MNAAEAARILNDDCWGPNSYHAATPRRGAKTPARKEFRARVCVQLLCLTWSPTRLLTRSSDHLITSHDQVAPPQWRLQHPPRTLPPQGWPQRMPQRQHAFSATTFGGHKKLSIPPAIASSHGHQQGNRQKASPAHHGTSTPWVQSDANCHNNRALRHRLRFRRRVDREEHGARRAGEGNAARQCSQLCASRSVASVAKSPCHSTSRSR